MSTNTTDPLVDLHDHLTALLWQLYGYPGALGDAHPVTQETYRADAAAAVYRTVAMMRRIEAALDADRAGAEGER